MRVLPRVFTLRRQGGAARSGASNTPTGQCHRKGGTLGSERGTIDGHPAIMCYEDMGFANLLQAKLDGRGNKTCRLQGERIPHEAKEC